MITGVKLYDIVKDWMSSINVPHVSISKDITANPTLYRIVKTLTDSRSFHVAFIDDDKVIFSPMFCDRVSSVELYASDPDFFNKLETSLRKCL